MKRRALVGSAVAIAIAVLAPGASAAARVPKSFTGVTLGFYGNEPPTGQLDLLAGAHVRSVRFSIFWPGVEPSALGGEDWSQIDRLIGAIASRGIQPIPVLYGTPSWVVNGVLGGNAPASTVPVQTASEEGDWTQWVKDAVARYGPGGDFWNGTYQSLYPGAASRPVRMWQVWNEPNLKEFYSPKPSPAGYAELVRISDSAIKSVDPGATVALAGMPGQVKFPGYKFLAKLYKVRGFRSEFDLAAAHTYGINLKRIRQQVAKFRSVMKKAGDARTRLWISEYSWGSANGGSRLNRGRRGQAKLLAKTLRMLVAGRHRWKLAGASWFDVQDPPSSPSGVGCDWCASAGLLDQNGAPKPSWRKFRHLVHG